MDDEALAVRLLLHRLAMSYGGMYLPDTYICMHSLRIVMSESEWYWLLQSACQLKLPIVSTNAQLLARFAICTQLSGLVTCTRCGTIRVQAHRTDCLNLSREWSVPLNSAESLSP